MCGDFSMPMIDRLLKQDSPICSHALDWGKYNEFQEVLKNATALDITNVSDYFFKVNEQEHWEYEKDFPNIAPPWPNIWFDWKVPEYINSEGKLLKNLNHRTIIRNGVHLLSCMTPKEFPNTNIKWGCSALFFAELHGEIQIYPIGIQFFVGEKGIFLKYSKVLPTLTNDPKADFNVLVLSKNLSRQNIDEIRMFVSIMLDVVFMALSFIHCKNIQISPAKTFQSVKNPKKNKKHFIKYYTLEIDPIKKMLDGVMSNKTNIKKALHICRGHFATYSPEKPLFGKFTGTIWKPMHTRGNSKIGEIVKDYKVKI
jgi:hypothetical protein